MKRHFKDIGIVGLTDFAKTLKAFILIPILTKTIGAEGYGILTQLRVTLMLLSPFLMLGLDSAVVRFLSGQKNKDAVRNGFLSSITLVFSFSVIVGLTLVIFSHDAAYYILGDRRLFYLIRLLGALLVLYPLDHLLVTYFRIFQQMKNYFIFVNTEIVIEVFLVWFIVLKGFGLFGVLYALILSKLVVLIVKAINIIHQVGFLVPQWDRLKNFIIFGLPLTLAASFYLVLNYGDRYIIRCFLGSDQVGIYSVGYALGMLIIVVMTPFDYVLYPKIVAYWNNNEIGKVKMYIKRTLGMSIAISTAICILMMIFARRMVVFISDESFISAVTVIPYIASGFLIFGAGIAGERILTLLNKTRLIIYIYGFLASLNILLNIIFIPRLGIEGAALATFITFILYSSITLGMTRKYIF